MELFFLHRQASEIKITKAFSSWNPERFHWNEKPTVEQSIFPKKHDKHNIPMWMKLKIQTEIINDDLWHKWFDVTFYSFRQPNKNSVGKSTVKKKYKCVFKRNSFRWDVFLLRNKFPRYRARHKEESHIWSNLSFYHFLKPWVTAIFKLISFHFYT